MSTFADNLLNGSWNVQCANGEYLAIDPSRRDSAGNPLATTVAARADAAKLTFTQVSAVSATNLLVTAQAGAGKNLSANPQGQVVFTGAAAPQFNAVQLNSSVFALGQGVSGTSGSYATLDTSARTFTLVSGAPQRDAGLFLAPDLPVGAQLWSFSTAQKMVGTPYVYQGAVYLGDGNTLLNCVDMLTGKVLWEYGDGTGSVCPPEVNYANALVFAADGKGLLRAVDLNSGQERWTFQAPGPVYSRPSAYVGNLLVPSSSGVLCCLSTNSGAELWRYPSSGTLSGMFSSPAMGGQTAFVGAWDNKLHAVNVTSGSQVWSYDAGNKVNGDVETDADTVYFGTDNGQLAALRQSDGSQRWVFDTGGIIAGRPLLYGGNVYVGNYAGEFYAVSAATGAQAWKRTFAGAYVGSAAQAADGVVYFNTTTGTLYALDAGSGATLATYTAGGQMDGSAILYSGALYFGTQSGVVASAGQRLSAAFNPVDSVTLLMLSAYANLAAGQAQHDPEQLPAGCTQLGEFRWTASTCFGTGAVLQLRLAGTDRPVAVLALGVQTDTFPTYFDTFDAPLADVPATILGSGAPAGVQANQSLLESYLDIRTAMLAALQPAAGSEVVITGFAGGGALAALAALDLGTPKSGLPALGALSLQSFGAPATGNQAFATLLAQKVPGALRVVSVMDTFPDVLPPAKGYAQSGTPVTIGAAEVITANGCPQNTVSCYHTCLTGRM
ncbi:MAG TPA: PQQ-binding-like beta-propeller repeat protein [Longimicrobium sp.]|nr:PQQ-binding-like beta-propeller repeat protein [Longimicrobium sp.]